MKIRGALVGVVLATLAACGGGDDEEYAVPPGAIPAAPDARPAEEEASVAVDSIVADTMQTGGALDPARSGGDTATAPSRPGRTIPR